MLKREEWLPGVPSWIDTQQPDAAAAAEFYGGLFGWEFDERYAPGQSEPYRIATLHGLEVGAIARQMGDQGGPAAWNTYVCVADAEETAARVRDAGGTVIVDPFPVGPAGRSAVFADPAGAVFLVWQPGATKGAQLVNDPGTWNFSGLVTGDVDGAVAFYGAVFGWETSPSGDDGGFFWRRPGYGDHLASIQPGIRERFESMGAPEGFIDVVAWVRPAGDGAAPGWHVVFGVDDADATAARAQELGATVVMEPTDQPWVRSTVLRDPQGAVFTANKFVPPER